MNKIGTLKTVTNSPEHWLLARLYLTYGGVPRFGKRTSSLSLPNDGPYERRIVINGDVREQVRVLETSAGQPADRWADTPYRARHGVAAAGAIIDSGGRYRREFLGMAGR